MKTVIIILLPLHQAFRMLFVARSYSLTCIGELQLHVYVVYAHE